jgi:hypothetical protein
MNICIHSCLPSHCLLCNAIMKGSLRLGNNLNSSYSIDDEQGHSGSQHRSTMYSNLSNLIMLQQKTEPEFWKLEACSLYERTMVRKKWRRKQIERRIQWVCVVPDWVWWNKVVWESIRGVHLLQMDAGRQGLRKTDYESWHRTKAAVNLEAKEQRQFTLWTLQIVLNWGPRYCQRWKVQHLSNSSGPSE